jgi:hypothetical protein
LRQAVDQRSSVADAQAGILKLAAMCAAARQPQVRPTPGVKTL